MRPTALRGSLDVVVALALYFRILVAFALAFVIGYVGFKVLRAVGGAARPGAGDSEPEDVSNLAVFFVCRECGTEFQVTKVPDQVQVPRHCGEKMEVVQRPLGAPPPSAN